MVPAEALAPLALVVDKTGALHGALLLTGVLVRDDIEVARDAEDALRKLERRAHALVLVDASIVDRAVLLTMEAASPHATLVIVGTREERLALGREDDPRWIEEPISAVALADCIDVALSAIKAPRRRSDVVASRPLRPAVARTPRVRCSGAIVRGAAPRALYATAVVDKKGCLTILAAEAVKGGRAAARAIADAAEEALESNPSIATVARAIDAEAKRLGATARFVLLRFAHDSSHIEVMNAGMPAVRAVDASGAAIAFPSRSGPIGECVGHPHEMISIRGRTAFVIASDDCATAIDLGAIEASLAHPRGVEELAKHALGAPDSDVLVVGGVAHAPA